MRHRITAFGVACAFLVCCVLAVWVMVALQGCALLQIGQAYKTFELTIDSQKVIVNLPKGFPNMDEAIDAGEMCWDTKLCAQQFCLSNEPIHSHVRFFYSGKDVVALMWCSTVMKEECRHWLYVEDVLTEVDYGQFEAFLDSLWKDPPSKQEGTV